MATNTTPSKSATVTSTTKPVVEPTKPADDKAESDNKAVEPAKAESPTAPAASDGGKSAEKTIISLSVPEKLARQVRLLAKLEGKTISAIFLNAVEKDIPARLKAALATITDLE